VAGLQAPLEAAVHATPDALERDVAARCDHGCDQWGALAAQVLRDARADVALGKPEVMARDAVPVTGRPGSRCSRYT
jgi:hypothetical protein